MAELKPCKCVGVGVTYCLPSGNSSSFCVACHKCGYRTRFFQTLQQAIDAWNKRS